jgi:pimeloyl-ACP methyl ester carboxylesterase
MKRLAFAAALALAAAASHAAGAPHEEIMRVDVRPGVVEPVLLSMASAEQKPKRVLLLFPGGDGVMEIARSAGGARFRLAGNFLIRARARFVDAEDAAVSVDMPSDEYCCANDRFRLGERHAADVAKILDALAARFPGTQFYLVGTSRGTISAASLAARLGPQRIAGVVLTSTLTLGGPIKPGLSHFDYSGLKLPVLFVHHKDDGCRFTPYAEAERIARKYRFALVTVTGSAGAHGPACKARSYHGYPGREKEVAAAIMQWVKTRAVAPTIK